MTDKKKLTTYIIIGAIGMVAILVAVELITLFERPANNNSGLQSSELALVTSSYEASSESIEREPIAEIETPPVAPTLLEHEITDLMTAFGVDDLDGEFVPEVYDETDVESLSLGNVNQVAPAAGTYKAINLFEQGVEKNLRALEGQGRSISITVDGQGNATIDFLGLEFDATYDNHYLYLEDGSKMPYYWDGQTITTAAHRIELDLVLVK